MLPKFLLADNSQEQLGKLFVVHTENPKFILEGSDEDFDLEQIIHWIDNPITDDKQITDLINLATNFLEKELDNQEDLYDDMDDE